MGYSVKEMAKLTGVSIRTLHYYDEIGLLIPKKDSQNGYRVYDKEDLSRLEQILFFRELEFSLKEIAEILDDPDYDRNWALKRQKTLLIRKRDHLNELTDLIDLLLEEEPMKQEDRNYEDLKEQYAKEARQRWGNSDAYREFQEKHSEYTQERSDEITKKANEIFEKFASMRNEDPASESVQSLVAEWQDHISQFHYQCNKEMLSYLGQMYVSDERFRENLDRFGDGNAVFMAKAIEIYCK